MEAIDLINESIKSLKDDMSKRLERIETKLDGKMSKDDCKSVRDNCSQNTTVQTELSIKRITAIGGVITATIATSTATIVTIIKLINP
jgi:hypothetical protein